MIHTTVFSRPALIPAKLAHFEHCNSDCTSLVIMTMQIQKVRKSEKTMIQEETLFEQF